MLETSLLGHESTLRRGRIRENWLGFGGIHLLRSRERHCRTATTILNSELSLLYGNGRHLVATEWRLAKLRICAKRLRRAYSGCLLLEVHRLGLTWLLSSVLQWVDLLVLDYWSLLLVLLMLVRVLVLLLLVLLLLLLLVLVLVLLLTHAGLLIFHCMCMSLAQLLNNWLRRVMAWTPST